ncbi:MAG: FtsX-like permease family protein [bacterium]
MSAIARGAKNALRNPGRALAVTMILGLSLGLALTMAMSRAAVDHSIGDARSAADARIANVNGAFANSLQLRPASGGGAFGGFGGQATMLQANITDAAFVPHVTELAQLLIRQVPATNTSLVPVSGGFGGRAQASLGPCDVPPPQTGGDGGRGFAPGVSVLGADDLNVIAGSGGGTVAITQGSAFNPKTDSSSILLGCVLAKSNNLVPGSSVSLYGVSLTVTGIFDTGTQFNNRGAVTGLGTLQALTNNVGVVSQAVAVVDSPQNLNATLAAVRVVVGSDIDVTSQADSAQAVTQAIQTADQAQEASLSTISGIAASSMVGAVAASGVIILLTMFMIVRERRREIGVLKAIGASGARVVSQFVAEALTFAILAALVGGVVGLLSGNGVANILVKANAQATPSPVMAGGPGGRFGGFAGGPAVQLPAPTVQTHIDPVLLLVGLAVVVGIAVLGSAIPSWAISRIRPSEVLRGE